MNGVAHGPVIIKGLAPILPVRLERPYADLVRSVDSEKLGFIGRFSNGYPEGTFWLQMIGGGFMHGKFNQKGEATGKELFYIYPDMETGFQGSFTNFVMEKASAVDIVSTECEELLSISKVDMKSEPIFYYNPPTNVRYT